MNVLVTGGVGFVGRHFVKRFVADGHKVTVVDLCLVDSAVRVPFHQGYHIIVDDFRRYCRIESCDQFDMIVHCAAMVGGRRLIDGDPIGVATNLAIDSDFFNWIVRGKKKKHIIYFSSSAVYPVELQGRRMNCLLSETLQGFDSLRVGLPETTYGFAKLAGEYLAKQAREHYGVDVKVYRPFGGYGEDQDLDYPFPSIVDRVFQRHNPVIVWGSGEQQRDFIHIDDIVEAVLATHDKEWPVTALNLGTGNGISFRRLAELACIVAGYEPQVINDASKPEGVFMRVADLCFLGRFYKPKISLVAGIERALAYRSAKSLTPDAA